MSWLEALTDYGADVGNPGVAAYTRGAIIQYRVGQGWSAGSIMRELRVNGLGIRNEQGLSLIRAEQARQSVGLTGAQIGVDYTTGELLPGAPPDNWTGQYVHQVTVTSRERLPDGSYVLHARTMGIVAGQPLSPLGATQSALEQMTQAPTEGEEPTGPQLSDILTTELTGVWYRTGRPLTAA